MLLDDILPRYHFQETHSRVIAAPASEVMAAALAYRPEADPFFRRAIALRELPARLFAKHDSPAFSMQNFTPLCANDTEAVFGMVGRFWQLGYGQDDLPDLARFREYAAAGAVKLALNYHIAQENGVLRLGTHTRVYCIDPQAKRHFAPYWYLIRPVSGLIRRRVLAAIARDLRKGFT